jgi:hypothetical protein
MIWRRRKGALSISDGGIEERGKGASSKGTSFSVLAKNWVVGGGSKKKYGYW